MFLGQPWRDDAACKGVDTNVFLVTTRGRGRDGARHVSTKVAYSYCRECSVRIPCLDYAMDLPYRDSDGAGVYGLTSGSDRTKLRKWLLRHDMDWTSLTTEAKQALLQYLGIGQG